MKIICAPKRNEEEGECQRRGAGGGRVLGWNCGQGLLLMDEVFVSMLAGVGN